jgi:hypothetical protein
MKRRKKKMEINVKDNSVQEVREEKKEILLESNHAEVKPEVISHILHDMAQVLEKSYGPTGASTLMITGDKENAMGTMTKDGFTLLSKTKYFHPLPVALKKLLLNSMLGVLKTASDGTTTTTLLIDKMYASMHNNFKGMKIPAQVFQNIAKGVVKDIIEEIDNIAMYGKANIEDLFGIIETTTNNDEELADTLKEAVNEVTDGGRYLNDISLTFKQDGTVQGSKYEIKEGYTIPASPIGFPRAVLRRKVIPIIVNSNIGTGETIRALITLYTALGRSYAQTIKQGVDMNQLPPVLLITYNLQYKEVLEREMVLFANQLKEEFDLNYVPVYILEFNYDGSLMSLNEHRDFEYLIGQTQAYELDKKVKDIFPDDTNLPEEKKEESVVKYVFDRFISGKMQTIDAIISKSSTTLYNFNEERKEELKKSLEEEIEDNSSDKEKVELLQRRLRRVSGKYAEITIGGENSWDIGRKVDAIEDSLGAIRAAISSGVCGGMSTLIMKVYNRVAHKYRGRTHQFVILNDIYNAYHSLFDILLTNAGVPPRTFETHQSGIIQPVGFIDSHYGVYFDIDELLKEFDSRKSIRFSFDIHSILNAITKGKEVKSADHIAFHVLNSIDGEKRILEASVQAVLSLISMNQITMPDQYDVAAYTTNTL